MNAINPNQYSIDEFKSHLKTMNETLKNNKSLAPDFFDGFIEFFNNEITHFNSSIPKEKKITLIDSALDKLDQTIKQVASVLNENKKPQDIVVPRLRDKIDAATLANQYEGGNVKTGLTTLDNNYTIYPIKGDGHCLYRSILGQILLLCPKLSDNHYNEFLNNQVIFIDDEIKLQKPYNLLKDYLDTLRGLPVEQQERRFQEIMMESKNSDKLVEYLRQLCEKHHRENPNEVSQSEFTLSSGSVDKYLTELVSMKGAIALGGQPEIIALADVLGVRFHVLNCDTIGQGENYQLPYNYYGADDSPVTFPLLFRPGHYDMAVAK